MSLNAYFEFFSCNFYMFSPGYKCINYYNQNLSLNANDTHLLKKQKFINYLY